MDVIGRLRVVAAVALVASAVGCSAGVATPEPSEACGGFHLSVTNHLDTSITVRLDGATAETILAGLDAEIWESGYGEKAPMPWTVEIVDAASGAVIGTRDVSRDSGDGAASIDVTDKPGGIPTVSEVAPATGC